MLYRSIALALICLLPVGAARGEEPQPAEKPVLRAIPAQSLVWQATDLGAIDHFSENPAVSRRLVNAVIAGLTGESDVGRAWRSLVDPKERIGIKVNAGAGPRFSTRPGVVRAIIDGLEQAGVNPKSIVVWDRQLAELRAAGFDPKYLGCQVRGTEPPRGWDRKNFFAAPAPGRLIWGDALFVEKNLKMLGRQVSDEDQLSANSYFSQIVTGEVSKIINVATLTDDAGCGIGGVFYNLCVKNVDNWRRFVAPELAASDSIPELYRQPQLGPKVVVHFLDALVGQYAGGPAGNPNYAVDEGTLYASKDPVALDSIGVRRIDEWRKAAKLPPVAERARWLQTAAELGIGEAAESRIKLVPVKP